VLQMIMPNLSFCGHISGITTGTLQLYGVWDCILVTDETVLRELEDWNVVKWLRSTFPGFIPTPALMERHRTHGLMSVFNTVRRGVLWVYYALVNLVEAAVIIVFGRGRSLNSNIQLNLFDGDASLDNDTDDDWNGLPLTTPQPIDSCNV